MRGRRRGIALLTSLLILVFLFLLGLTFRFACDQNLIFSADVARRIQLQYLAEAGIEYWYSQRTVWTGGIPPMNYCEFTMPQGYVLISIFTNPAGGGYVIISMAKFQKTDSSSVIITAHMSAAGDLQIYQIE
ncbi:MAG: hypothetical protein RDV48_03070 [Candidatus Eremiobacteraeota bacterium]|nr:hypothetical protein [Candidatus Eremiobacteraeota bacterium]